LGPPLFPFTTLFRSFAAGIAIPLVSDTFSALMITVTSLTTAATMIFLATTGEDKYRFVPALALMLLAGVNGALLTGDLFNLFVLDRKSTRLHSSHVS